MTDIDFIIISQSEVVNYEQYSKLPLDKLELYKHLIFPRMVYFKEGFHSHLDLINYYKNGIFYLDAGYSERKKLLNIWHLPGFSGIHLANYLLKYGIKTKVINFFDSEWDNFCEIYRSANRPPLVGISSTYYLSYSEVSRLAKKLRKFDADIEIVLGGAFVNEQVLNNSLEVLRKPMLRQKINYALYAFNSEKDLKDLILCRRENGDLEKVNNLTYYKEGDFKEENFRVTNSNWNEAELNNSPLWSDIDMPFLSNTIQLRTSSGCPFSCAFCSYPTTAGGFFLMDIENVEKNIKSVLRQKNLKNIIFIDDTFNVPPKRFKEMCRIFEKYSFEWFSFLRAQFVDDETAKLMKESGCKAVYLGVESSNDIVLKNMNKKATRKDFIRGIELLNKYEIDSLAAFVLGFPGETNETINENIEFIENTGIKFYTLKEFFYMKHTPVYESRKKYGLTGLETDWKHNTMDYDTANKKKIEMFKQIKNSVFIDPDTSLWYIAYLYDQGLSIDDIVKIQKEINSIMHRQLNYDFDENENFVNLKNVVKEGTGKK